MVVALGCHPHGPMVKRNSELSCPTDIRQTIPWCAGEDAVFHCPCGPNREFYGYKPTCWGIWPAPAEQWRDSHCGPLVREESYDATGTPVLELPSQPMFAPLKSEDNSDTGRVEYPLPEPEDVSKPKAPRPRAASGNEAEIEDQSGANQKRPMKRDLRQSQESVRKIGAAMRRRSNEPNNVRISSKGSVAHQEGSQASSLSLVTTAKYSAVESGSVLQVAYHESQPMPYFGHYQRQIIILNRHSYQR